MVRSPSGESYYLSMRDAAANEPMWFSVNDLAARWRCGRTFAYKAIGEMETGGYLKRLFIGSDQRVSLESVAMWERLHSAAIGEQSTAAKVVTLREQNAPKRRQKPEAHPEGSRGQALLAAWKKVRAAS